MIYISPKTITNADVDALSDWLKTYPRLTQGDMVKEFERRFADWIGRPHAVMVNSGSSANLLMLAAIKENLPNDEEIKVVVPAVSWSTDLAPVIQLGMEPILCDCNMQNLSVDIDALQKIFEKEKPNILMLVSIIGLPPRMNEINELCDYYNVLLLEDACESMGSRICGRKLGAWGKASAFSLYYSHQMSCIEGGIVATDNSAFADMIRCLREHGWNRNCSPRFRQIHNNRNNISEWDSMFTFYFPGYNMRSTEINAFLALRQLENIGEVVNKRHKYFEKYLCLIDDKFWKPEYKTDTLVSCMAYPVIVKNREVVVRKMKEICVETRPLVAGSMEMQPMFKRNFYTRGVFCENARLIHNCGMYLPLHQDMTNTAIEHIAEILNMTGEPIS